MSKVPIENVRAMCEERTAENRRRLEDEDRRIGALEHSVYGNGRPGALERISALERSLQTQTWLLRLLIGGIVSFALGMKLKGG